MEEHSGQNPLPSKAYDEALFEGRRHYASGDRIAAARSFKQATESEPSFAEGWHELGLVLGDLTQFGEALQALSRASELAPERADICNDLGNALQSSRKYAEALTAYRRAAELAPDVAIPWVNMGDMLRLLDDVPAALACYEHALTLDPDFDDARYKVACILVAGSEHGAALEQIDHCLRRVPYSPDLLALRIVALAALGRRDEAAYLLDYEHFLGSIEIEVPSEYGGVRQFNRALEKHILENTKMTPDPFDASTRGGNHSDDILGNASGPAIGLKRALQGAIAEYLDRLPNDPQHPFIAAFPDQVQVVAQANVLDPEGYLINHVHPQGWLSGAYYVRLPNEISADDPRHRGWLQFGELPDEIDCRAPFDPVFMHPREGMLALFPSYFYHGTVAFSGAKHRMSLGVDVIARV